MFRGIISEEQLLAEGAARMAVLDRLIRAEDIRQARYHTRRRRPFAHRDRAAWQQRRAEYLERLEEAQQ